MSCIAQAALSHYNPTLYLPPECCKLPSLAFLCNFPHLSSSELSCIYAYEYLLSLEVDQEYANIDNFKGSG